jgi:hypothetical protein
MGERKYKDVEKIYVHYGTSHFDREKFKSLENIPYWMKSKFGLWGSPIDSPNDWEQWCQDNEFREVNEKECFISEKEVGKYMRLQQRRI